ncbi:unnamed protein product [Brassica napus]|uniref:(rape) hypothetical protein n=1 Tax=Brassica napus TaxID=3708 RepID=A0A816J859_BRANA|nr:unnamed protein product [Brassica napus]
MLSKNCTVYACLSSSSSVHYIQDEVLLMRWAPSLGAAGLATLPRPEDKGFALEVGVGAAMAAQGSSSSVDSFEAAEAKDGAEEEEEEEEEEEARGA